MFEPLLVAVLLVLVGALVIAPCMLRLHPRSSREWRWIVATVAFLIWLLAGFRSVR